MKFLMMEDPENIGIHNMPKKLQVLISKIQYFFYKLIIRTLVNYSAPENC